LLFGLTILDIVLILILLAYLVGGLRKGFLVTLGGIVGFVLGAIAAFLSVPFVSMWVPDPGWRLTAIIGVAVLLVSWATPWALASAVQSGEGSTFPR